MSLRSFVAPLLVVLAACAPPRPPSAAPATYGAELEVCNATNATCQGYLACRWRVQDRYHRPRTGACLE